MDQNARGRRIAIAHLMRDIEHPDHNETALLEHLAEWGPEGIDVQALAAWALADPDERGPVPAPPAEPNRLVEVEDLPEPIGWVN